jgi:hypothetical protein
MSLDPARRCVEQHLYALVHEQFPQRSADIREDFIGSDRFFD